MSGAVRSEGGGARVGLTDWLGLAAAPTFGTLALLGGVSGGEGACGHAGSGMTAMYALMALFHLPAWLRRLGRP